MARAKKLDSEYYQAVKTVLKEAVGVPKTAWEEVSSGWKEYFRPEAVTLHLNSPKWFKGPLAFKRDCRGVTQEYLKVLETLPKSPELKNKFPNAEIIIKDLGAEGVLGNYWEPVDSLFITVPQTDIEPLIQATPAPDHDIISFWATSVGDGYNEAIAYGARITTTDGWKFPDKASISRIQQRLGESHFTHYYSKGATKSFTSYNSLVKYLKSLDSYINPVSEQRIIDSGYDESYYTN